MRRAGTAVPHTKLACRVAGSRPYIRHRAMWAWRKSRDGHEVQVIEGAQELLHRYCSNLLAEIVEGRRDRQQIAPNHAACLLDRLGYEIYVFARSVLMPLSDAPLNQTTMNYIFLPRNATGHGDLR